jgi:hypothetical protein
MVRDNMKRWTRRPPGELFALMKMDSGAISGWFNSLESATPKEDGKYLCVSRTGVATTPFVVERKESDDCYAVYFPYHSCCCDEPFGPTSQSVLQRERTEVKSISLGWSEGTKEYVQGNVLYIPKAWKVIELEAPRKKDDGGYIISRHEKEDPLIPGTFFDLKLEVFNKTAKLAIDNDGIQVSVNDKRMSPVDAMVSLVCEHGLTEQMAKTAIAEAGIACRRHQDVPVYRIKYAAPFPMFREGPNAPAFDDDAFMTSDPVFGSGRPAITSMPQRQLVPGMEGKMREPINREPLPGPPSVEDVMGAAQSGKREVFDTSLLSSLVDSTQRESLVDRNLDDMIKGLDRTGRTLFSFYTHPEEFEEEFGASDMTEIEDGLRNAFDASGKIVLKLKQQSSDPAMLGQVEPDIGTFN